MSGGPRGTPVPLDLRAVEARLHAAINGVEYAGAVDDVAALLAHVRTLRAVLQQVYDYDTLPTQVDYVAKYDGDDLTVDEHRRQVLERMAAVLGAAQDGP